MFLWLGKYVLYTGAALGFFFGGGRGVGVRRGPGASAPEATFPHDEENVDLRKRSDFSRKVYEGTRLKFLYSCCKVVYYSDGL